MKTNKQTIYSNIIPKVFNRKRLTGKSFSKMKVSANIVKRKYFSGIYCKWEHLQEIILKEKILFSIAKEGTRLKRVIRD